MTLIFALIALMTWLTASRWLFRRWVRNDSLTTWNPYRSRHPLPHGAVAALAAGAALALPATLFMLAIMRNPPMSRQALAERTASLEKECEELRKAQARQEPGELYLGL